MINRLDKYRAYKHAVERCLQESATLNEFSTLLKDDPGLTGFRARARAELQALYDYLRRDFDLPELPVYLPVRKKIAVYGAAFHHGGNPTEIRIYCLKGCAGKPYDKWTPGDISVCTEAELFETFIHETAHILEATRNGRIGHGKPFIKAYEAIEEYFINNRFGYLIDPGIRLMGVPMKAKAVR
jgi:hypothetical protein